jgi:hypothetical protein
MFMHFQVKIKLWLYGYILEGHEIKDGNDVAWCKLNRYRIFKFLLKIHALFSSSGMMINIWRMAVAMSEMWSFSYPKMKINPVWIEKTWIYCLLYTFFSFFLTLWRVPF